MQAGPTSSQIWSRLLMVRPRVCIFFLLVRSKLIKCIFQHWGPVLCNHGYFHCCMRARLPLDHHRLQYCHTAKNIISHLVSISWTWVTMSTNHDYTQRMVNPYVDHCYGLGKTMSPNGPCARSWLLMQQYWGGGIFMRWSLVKGGTLRFCDIASVSDRMCS